MDTRSISSRKAGLLAAAVLLCICSAAMMLRYQDMEEWVESSEDIGARQAKTLYEMGGDLSEGNYLLYNEYSRETAFSDVLERYKDELRPAIILIPGREGSLGIGMENIKRSIQRAVGADIL